jgi:hypothetical protein
VGGGGGGAGAPRLLIPVILALSYNRWNQLYAGDAGVTLQLIPELLGFFTYKLAVVARQGVQVGVALEAVCGRLGWHSSVAGPGEWCSCGGRVGRGHMVYMMLLLRDAQVNVAHRHQPYTARVCMDINGPPLPNPCMLLSWLCRSCKSLART